MSDNIKVRFINNDGAGTAGEVICPAGLSVGDFLRQNGVTNPSLFYIRVNGQECVLDNDRLANGDRISAVNRPGVLGADSALGEGARVSVTPKNIAGALKALEAAIFKDC